MTEEPSSPIFQTDGYWLGPIWVPSTYLFIDGLQLAGQINHARLLAKKIAELTLESGIAENFNPYTGEGNDDLAFAWPSAVLLSLTEYLD